MFTLGNAEMNITRENLAQNGPVVRGVSTPPRWVLDNGRDFEFSPLPKGVRRKRPKFCYSNSMRLAGKDRDRYVYVEGFASTPLASGLPHAWCFDRKTRLVVDLTLQVAIDYVGVPIRYSYAWKVCERNRLFGNVIDDWDAGCPLVTGAVPREEWEEQL